MLTQEDVDKAEWVAAHKHYYTDAFGVADALAALDDAWDKYIKLKEGRKMVTQEDVNKAKADLFEAYKTSAKAGASVARADAARLDARAAYDDAAEVFNISTVNNVDRREAALAVDRARAAIDYADAAYYDAYDDAYEAYANTHAALTNYWKLAAPEKA